MKLESEVTLEFRKALLRKMAYAVKIVQFGGKMEKGIPDLLVCWNSKFVGIEMKMRVGNKLDYSDHQKNHLRRIRQANGYAVGVAYDRNTGLYALDLLTNGETAHLVWYDLAKVLELMQELMKL